MPHPFSECQYADPPGAQASHIYTDAEAEDMDSDWDEENSDSKDEAEEGSKSEQEPQNSMGILKGVLLESPITRDGSSCDEHDGPGEFCVFELHACVHLHLFAFHLRFICNHLHFLSMCL